MQREFGLHELAVEDARHGHQRPKIEEYGDSLFAVLHTVEIDGDELKVGEVDIFVGKNYVLSVRSRTEQGFADVRARSEREPHLLKHGSGFVLYALMDAVVDRYFPVLDALEDELEEVEERIFGGHRRARTSRRSMPEAKADGAQARGRPAARGRRQALRRARAGSMHRTQEYFRDVYDHLSRLNQSIDSLREMATTAISVNLSLITVQENETIKRLAAYAALVAVPTMIAGIYGMNFEHMPELKWAVRLSARDRRDGRDRRLPVLSLPESHVALTSHLLHLTRNCQS